MSSPAPGRPTDPGCGRAAALALVVVAGVAAVLVWIGSGLAARNEDEEPRPVVLQVRIEVDAGERAEGAYVLALSADDADAMGVPRSIPVEHGTFKLRTGTELPPMRTYSYCLEDEAAIRLDGADAGTVPAGTCMAGGGSNRTPTIRVRA